MSTQFLPRIRSRRAGSFLLNASYQSETFFLSARASAAWASGPIIITPGRRADISASRCSFTSSAICVEAECTGSERHDLQQATGHRDVFEEVDELVQVREIVVKGGRGR